MRLDEQSKASDQNVPIQGREMLITQAFLQRPDGRRLGDRTRHSEYGCREQTGALGKKLCVPGVQWASLALARTRWPQNLPGAEIPETWLRAHWGLKQWSLAPRGVLSSS